MTHRFTGNYSSAVRKNHRARAARSPNCPGSRSTLFLPYPSRRDARYTEYCEYERKIARTNVTPKLVRYFYRVPVAVLCTVVYLIVSRITVLKVRASNEAQETIEITKFTGFSLFSRKWRRVLWKRLLPVRMTRSERKRTKLAGRWARTTVIESWR